jgi:hypothetical protein
MMNIALALLLASNLVAAGKPAFVVKSGADKASVYLEGRPGCHAEALNDDPKNPVVVCFSTR